MNNFVSFRPQVLRKKVSVTRDSDRSFSTLLFLFVRIRGRPHDNQIWTREVLQLKLSSSCPRIPPLICSSWPFLLNSGYWNHIPHLLFEKKNCTYPWVYFFGRPTWRGNVNFMRHFFPNCGNPTRSSRSRINPEVGGRQSHILSDVFATVAVFGA